MQPTQAQLIIIRNHIEQTPELSSISASGDGAYAIANWYNTEAENFLVWNTNVKVSQILDVLSWTKYTPTDAPDGTMVFLSRLLAAQTKLFSLQSMLQARDVLDASKLSVRQAVLDLVTALPTGEGGASASAGGENGLDVLMACARKGTRIEQLLIAEHAPLGPVSAYVMGFEGPIGYEDVQAARGSI